MRCFAGLEGAIADNLTRLVIGASKEGSFAFGFKSAYFPGELVMARRGSPLLIGVKTDKKLKVDFVDVEVAPESDKIELSSCSCERVVESAPIDS